MMTEEEYQQEDWLQRTGEMFVCPCGSQLLVSTHDDRYPDGVVCDEEGCGLSMKLKEDV